MEFGFFTPSWVGYDDIFLPVEGDIVMKSLSVVLRSYSFLSIVLSACFACFLVLASFNSLVEVSKAYNTV